MAEAGAKARVALITGGASGIGLATAERLLASGWKVAIVDRDEKALEGQRKQHGSSRRMFFWRRST